MKNIVIIGAGGVASALAKKCAQHNDVFGNIIIASRTATNAENTVAAARPYQKDGACQISHEVINAKDSAAVAELIRRHNVGMVLNAGSPHVNLGTMDGCLAAGAHYLDTAVYEEEGADCMPPPWYESYEWTKRDAFAEAGLTGILSIGFDPGVVNVFCAYAKASLFDEISEIDIMDVNAGQHRRFFATNFDPETNLREICDPAIYWDDGWQTAPPHSQSITFDFPRVGKNRVFLMGHEELHSLPSFIPATRIAFWMGFSERYLRVFGVLNKLGLLSAHEVDVEGTKVAPIKLIKALLPDPKSLAQEYTGEACIGCLVRGQKDGKRRAVFIYSPLSHEEANADIGVQAVSYSTAVPALAAAMLVFSGEWRVNKLVNVEELPPAPFLDLMPKLGITWAMREEAADINLPISNYDEDNPPVVL